MKEIRHTQEQHKGKYELYIDGNRVGEMTYKMPGDGLVFTIDHTEIDKGHRGKNYGEDLVLAIVEYARQERKKIDPICPFALAVFDKTPEIKDVRA